MSVQRFRILLELGKHLEHNMVLVDAGIHRRNLALPERAIKRRVDHRRIDAQPGGRRAVDDQLRLQTMYLLIAVGIQDQRYGPQLRQKLGSPFVQVAQVIGLERVLILRVTAAAPYTDVLLSLKKESCTGDARQFAPQAVDNLVRGCFTLF